MNRNLIYQYQWNQSRRKVECKYNVQLSAWLSYMNLRYLSEYVEVKLTTGVSMPVSCDGRRITFSEK